jgi:hypothetical protein
LIDSGGKLGFRATTKKAGVRCSLFGDFYCFCAVPADVGEFMAATASISTRKSGPAAATTQSCPLRHCLPDPVLLEMTRSRIDWKGRFR